MTRPRWEYMRVAYIYSTEPPVKRDGIQRQRTWSHVYYVYRPGQSEETIDSKHLNFDSYLNDLGNEGWELVSESVRETTLISPVYGWEMVGHPVRIVWTFKRPAED